MDMMSQALILAKKPHILIATPGRLVDHLENTKGFNLRSLKFLVNTYGLVLYTTKAIYCNTVFFNLQGNG